MKTKKQFYERVLKINKSVFPFLIGISFSFLLLESYMYIGFLRKFILLDSRYFLIFSIISISLLFYSKLSEEKYKSSTLEKFVLNLNAFLFFPISIFYWIMTVSNTIHYPNYVFATFHIQPENYLNVIFLSLLLFILKLYKLSKLKRGQYLRCIRGKLFVFNKAPKVLILLVVIFISLAVYVVSNLPIVLKSVFNNIIFVSTHLNYTYDDKMRKKWGFYYDYMEFIKSYTPPDATILIPPQSNHWLTSGNSGLDRYFLYPRNLLNADVFSIPNSGYGYVLIDKGEWYNDAVDWGWPKVAVKAEKIWYIDPGTLKVTEVEKDFDPKDPFNMQAWGLIKVRKVVQK